MEQRETVPGELIAYDVQENDVLCSDEGWKDYPGKKRFLKFVESYQVKYVYYIDSELCFIYSL